MSNIITIIFNFNIHANILGDPSVAQHPMIDEFVPLRLKNPVSTSTGPTVEPMDLVKELEQLRST